MAIEKTFDGDGNFAAFNACAAWLKARGFSVGQTQVSDARCRRAG